MLVNEGKNPPDLHYNGDCKNVVSGGFRVRGTTE